MSPTSAPVLDRGPSPTAVVKLTRDELRQLVEFVIRENVHCGGINVDDRVRRVADQVELYVGRRGWS